MLYHSHRPLDLQKSLKPRLDRSSCPWRVATHCQQMEPLLALCLFPGLNHNSLSLPWNCATTDKDTAHHHRCCCCCVTDRRRHLPPGTLAPRRKQLSRTSALARVSYGGMYSGRGQMSSTGADDGRAYSHAGHLILMRYISALYK